jgi:RTX calcium-binding nonapeptide repeat (4 copies)
LVAEFLGGLKDQPGRWKGGIMRRIAVVVATLLSVGGFTAAPASAYILCVGRQVTLFGTDGSDVLNGELVGGGRENANAIKGRGGADVIDTVSDNIWNTGCGGPGDDRITTIFGELWGERGDDRLEGPLLQGGPGNDTLLVHRWRTDTTVYGVGERGNDTITLVGQQPDAKTWMYGDAGDDVLDARDGVDGRRHDKVRGGHGIDTCYVDANDDARSCEYLTVEGA